MTMRQSTSQHGETISRIGRRRPEASPEAQSLIACLEEAGATLLSLPPSGFSPRLRTSTLPVLREAAEAYGWSLTELRAPMPSASRISRMDRAMGYLSLIPQDRYLLRRIVGCRALVHPVNGRHLFSWRRLGELMGADHKAIQRWHADGIRIILDALRQQAAETGRPSSPATPPVMTAMPGRRAPSLDRL
ncbi:hypothetical protein ACELLULO517_09165 [Acidisoma cellulosilytica]|uniref:DUF6362 domain-containing protein n=1 Tax=Acidisoma cellulosilyticum TaxID=2802395 RepID=A0A963Z200_9PROT|nr:DUF6362 family protein [Acidisoma cellulosilyticum]MCB8880400.1 hypothetical protein [Acidisoma cellulosilyticum]